MLLVTNAQTTAHLKSAGSQPISPGFARSPLHLLKNRKGKTADNQYCEDHEPNAAHSWIVVNVLVDRGGQVAFPSALVPLRGVWVIGPIFPSLQFLAKPYTDHEPL